MLLGADFTQSEIIYILAFYALGAALGFFSFRFDREKSKLENLFNCCFTTCLGMFFAYILACYLEEHHIFSKNMNMVLGGLGSFGLPDIVIKYYPRFTDKIANIAMAKVSSKCGVEDTENKRDKKNEQ